MEEKKYPAENETLRAVVEMADNNQKRQRRQWLTGVSAAAAAFLLIIALFAIRHIHLDLTNPYRYTEVIIAYAPCINHGIKKGMSKAQTEEKLAVETGYWNLFRFNPAAEKKFVVDSKAPTKEFQEFIGGEVRYTSLALKDAEKAARLQAQAAENAKERRDLSHVV